jgi:uncharacterized protein YceK
MKSMASDSEFGIKTGSHIRMRLFVLLVIALVFVGCALTPSVDNRKPGQRWNYYGDLLSVYRDQTGGTRVELVWLDQVQFQRVNQNEYQKVVQTYLSQGYRKIGMVSVRSQYFVDPYEVKKLAADKGARLVVGFWVQRGRWPMVDYQYQLLDKPNTPPVSVPPPPHVRIPTNKPQHRPVPY